VNTCPQTVPRVAQTGLIAATTFRGESFANFRVTLIDPSFLQRSSTNGTGDDKSLALA
jgi:hypothetical protein